MAATDWTATASVYLNDPDRGRVLIGPFGFAWWKGRKLFIAQFKAVESSPVMAYKTFEGSIKEYVADHVPMPAIIRFVRTGLIPA